MISIRSRLRHDKLEDNSLWCCGVNIFTRSDMTPFLFKKSQFICDEMSVFSCCFKMSNDIGMICDILCHAVAGDDGTNL